MSLCYDFEKWTMITLAAVALSLTIGVVSLAYGYIDPDKYRDSPGLPEKIIKYNEIEKVRDYCYEHASDSSNPVQDLVSKGFLNASMYMMTDCADINVIFDQLEGGLKISLSEYWNQHKIK